MVGGNQCKESMNAILELLFRDFSQKGKDGHL
jgi:hypothetical protein